MTVVHDDDRVSVHLGDCREVLASMPENSVDAIVTDPPYELTRNEGRARGFMDAPWDGTGVAFDPETWRAALRVLKPGGHLVAFGATRTSHRMVCAVEDAGFDIRDSIIWLCAARFPKSRDIGKALDAAAGATREVVSVGATIKRMRSTAGQEIAYAADGVDVPTYTFTVTAPATAEAQRWDGWGTALKPGHEPAVLARKPLQGTLAQNVLRWGTGGLNIDGCRIPAGDGGYAANQSGARGYTGARTNSGTGSEKGRWPANVALDEDVSAELDAHTGMLTSAANARRRSSDKTRDVYGASRREQGYVPARGADSGGASRFFYTAKASAKERPSYVDADGSRVSHNTVKPLSLMRWLVRMVTPPGGLVLDMFGGSGTTAEAAALEGVRCEIVEQDPAFVPLILQRLARTEHTSA